MSDDVMPCEHGSYGLCPQCVREERDRLRAELAEARRLLDEARKQEPVATLVWSDGGDDVVFEEFAHTFNGMKLYAAPVPAQPAVPDGWRVQDDGHRVTVCWNGAGYTLDDRHGNVQEAFCGFVRDVVKASAEPLAAPAQPAVPDDVARDAARLALVWRVATGRETDEERATLGNVSPNAEYDEFVAGIDAAIISATEGRSNG